MTVQDNGHFYLLSSSRKGGHSDWRHPASWNVKRIDNQAGTGALGGDISVPGYSEVLWVEPNKPNGIGTYLLSYIQIVPCNLLRHMMWVRASLGAGPPLHP